MQRIHLHIKERGIKGVRLRPRGLKPEGLKNNLHIKLPKEEVWKRL